MKKRARVIQISGLRGILMAIFIGGCLIAGFVGFPAICAMKLWNYTANFAPLPLINIYQGLMLWAIVAISGFKLSIFGNTVSFDAKPRILSAIV